jgi:hypothetical protein
MGQFLTTWFASRGELGHRVDLCPLGGKFTPMFTSKCENSLLFRRLRGQQRISPPGGKFTHTDKVHHTGDVKNGPLVM